MENILKKNPFIDINLPLHTVIITIAPSNAGKTYFVENIIKKQLKIRYPDLKFRHISSDNLRRNLLVDPKRDKYDDEMMQVSIQAFDLLESELNAAISYPVNNEIVVVDTTGLSDKFRQRIISIAQKNCYNVAALLFNYKNTEEYFLHQHNTKFSFVTKQHIRKLKENVLGKLGKTEYTAGIYEINSKFDFDKYNILVPSYDGYQQCFIPQNEEITVIGDIHGKYDLLLKLLEKNDFLDGYDKLKVTNKRKVLLIGDLIDKGSLEGQRQVIEFVYNNLDKIYIVKGNHENFVYKQLKGINTEKMPQDFLDKYFNSLELFKQDEELKNKFFTIVENSKVFYAQKGSFIATHAPCKTKYLGKYEANVKVYGKDKINATKKQIINYYPRIQENESYDDYMNSLDKHFSFLKEEAQSNHPYHVFGHVALFKKLTMFNKIGIDTGAVYNNKLSSVTFKNSSKPDYQSVGTVETCDKDLPVLFDRFRVNYNNFKEDELEMRELSRIKFLTQDKINFISGTVSPCDKDENDLESLKWGINHYFANDNVDKLILQPKYMGSRCNVYLHKDITDSYLVSRQGYLIKQIPFEKYEPELKRLRNKLDSYFKENSIEWLILDSELLPWTAMGKGLIEYDFLTYEKCIEKEIDILKKSGYSDILKNIKSSEQYRQWYVDMLSQQNSKTAIRNQKPLPFWQKLLGFKPKKIETKKEVLIKKYSEHINRIYTNIKNQEIVDVNDMEEMFEVYKEQMTLYATESDTIEIKPFSILKYITTDGENVTFENGSNIDNFKLVADQTEPYLVIEKKNPFALDAAKRFFDMITKIDKMEGIMIKPEQVYSKDLTPMLKCRNERYLTIVYGYDYKTPHKFNKLYTEKSIKTKKNISKNEWKIGMDMLKINREDITPENQGYRSIVGTFIQEERKVTGLDPRL